MFCCLKGCLNGFSLSPTAPIRIKENPVQLDTLHMVFFDNICTWRHCFGLSDHDYKTLFHCICVRLDSKLVVHLYGRAFRGSTLKSFTFANESGHEVVVVKGGQRVCGSGCALGNAPLVQNKAYFEVKLQQGGVWAVGLATRETDLNRVQGGVDKESWCLNSDGTVRHGNEELYHLEAATRDSPTADLLVATDSPAPAMPAEGDTIGLAYDHVELNFFVNGTSMEIPVRNIKGTVYPALYVDDGAILDIILEKFLYPPPTGYEKIMVEQSLL